MENKKKEEKKIISNNYKKLLILIALLVFIFLIFFVISNINKKEVYANSAIDIEKSIEFEVTTKEKIDLDSIINKNTESVEKQETEVQSIEIEYLTQYVENNELPKNQSCVIQEGRNGLEQVTINRKYLNDELLEEKEVNKKIVKATINKIVEIGTGDYSNNYKPKVGDLIYVTSNTLSVMTESSNESQKVATLFKDYKLKILEISGEWFKISSNNIIGWVKKECTTNIAPDQEYKESYEDGLSKSQLISKLSFDMNLYKPSGFSLEQFKKVLSDNKDSNKIFENNAEYFYYIEKQYNINGVFVAAVGIHESAWGTSKIARDKNNLFGYGAYDSNPYNGAYSFSNYSESIDLIARVFVKYYINPKGTNIYGGEQAVGTYYNGPTLTGINTKYATDKNWANGVYNHMKHLYNKL